MYSSKYPNCGDARTAFTGFACFLMPAWKTILASTVIVDPTRPGLAAARAQHSGTLLQRISAGT